MQTVGDSDTKSFARKKKKINLSTEEKILLLIRFSIPCSFIQWEFLNVAK